jgi:hypothetical protein
MPALMAAAAGALAALDLRASDGGEGGRAALPSVVLGADVLVLVGGASWLHTLGLAEHAPRLHMVLQSSVPLAACILGAYLAARWFVEDRARVRPAGVHVMRGTAVILIAAVASGLGRNNVWALGVVAAVVLGVVWAVAPFVGPRGVRRLGFGSAVALLWAGSFGLYLMVLPAQVVVANAESSLEEGRAAVTGWAVAALLLGALAAGFLKPRRGSRS